MASNKPKSSGLPPVTPKFAAALRLSQVEWDKLVEGMGRAPNEIECLIFSQLWSEEYCRKSTIGLTRDFQKFEPAEVRSSAGKFRLVDLGNDKFATVVVSENNLQTCVDSQIAAETCFVSAFADFIGAGIHPVAAMDVLRVGSLEHIRNHARLRSLLGGIARGSWVSGIPLVGGDTYFHPQFDTHPVCNVVSVGFCDRAELKPPRKAEYGQLVVLIGAKTGYDSFPKELPDFENGKPPTHAARRALRPKVSDTFHARQLGDVLLSALNSDLFVDLVPLDVGGIAVGSFELAVRNNTGLRFDLDKPLVLSGQFTPRGILISETPQRYLALVDREKHRQVVDFLSRRMLTIETVGEVLDSDNVHYTWKHKEVAIVPFRFAHQSFIEKKFELSPNPPMLVKKAGAESSGKAEKKGPLKKVQDDWTTLRTALSPDDSGALGRAGADANLADRWVDLLASPNVCSKALICEEFDQRVGANTVTGCGSDAAIVRLRNSQADATSLQELGLVLTVDCCAAFVTVDPYLGTLHTVAEALRNISAVGARPVAASFCLNFGDSTDMEVIFQMAEVTRAARVACDTWGIPVLSDKISVGCTTEMGNIPPTPIVALLGKLPDARKKCPQHFQQKGDRVFLVGVTREEVGGSEYAGYCQKKISTEVPEFDFDLERTVCDLMVELIEKDHILSCHDLSSGGLAVAITECCVQPSRSFGAQLTIQNSEKISSEALLFGETSGRFLISCAPAQEETVKQMCEAAGVPICGTGVVGGPSITIAGALSCSIPVSTASRIWFSALNHVFGVRAAA